MHISRGTPRSTIMRSLPLAQRGAKLHNTAVDAGFVLDSTFQRSFPEQCEVVRQAARLGYTSAWAPGPASRTEGYRGQFGRMGFDDVLTELEERRDHGASMDELIDALPVDLMRRVGYSGRPEGVAADFARLAVGLDTAVVRMITTAPGPAKVMLALEACRDVVRAGVG